MKKLATIFVLCLTFPCLAQQYPFWSQYRSNLYMLNPAVAGTRKTVDARLCYRNQWVGFKGAPVTMSASLHAALLKKKRLGVGGFVFRDKIGPSQFTTMAAGAAYKVPIGDVFISGGMNVSYNVQSIDFSFMTYRNTQDLALTNVMTTEKAKILNGASGILVYNERFHIGVGMNNMFGTAYLFDKSKNIRKYGQMKTVPHYALSIGYNWAEDLDYVFENNAMAVYVSGAPILLDYYLRMHIKQSLIVGAGIRFGTAVLAQVGWTFAENAQFTYSYDFNYNRLRPTNSGSHEIKLAIVFDDGSQNHHGLNKKFLKQKFQYLL